MSAAGQSSERLEARIFKNKGLAFVWLAFLTVVFVFIGWPVRDCLLVCWVYGGDAFLHQGVRVISAKPTRFSDGALAPTFPDLVTGFGAFLVTKVGLTLLLVAILRFYERHSQRR